MAEGRIKTGILGGTFDPPHLGHLAMAEYARCALDLESVWFLPAGRIPHKDSAHTLPAAERLAMTRLAVAGNPAFRVEPLEAESGRFSYTFETLELLRQREPNRDFVFILGADSLDYMERWREPARIFRCCTVAVVGRTGFSKSRVEAKRQALAEQFGAVTRLVEMPRLEISSTEVRARLRQGLSVRYLAPDSVLAYIQERGLYQAPEERQGEENRL